jgi:4-amino-4-deoxy-L-arabinose transferase-like glycosyltransferase
LRPDAPPLNRLRPSSPAQAVVWLIAIGTVIRLAFAAAIGLGIDESYMVAAGRTLRLGYFDHPPLAWWLSAGIAKLAGSEAHLIVRLPFVALFALSTWLMFQFGARLFGARAGAWAALALNLSPVFGVTGGTWVLPDGPLICALSAAALCFLRALEDGHWRWWLGTGAAAGFALLSKYNAALIFPGALFYLATTPRHRHWLARPQPYAAGVVAAALFVPVVAWNAMHGWASFAFQGGRAGGGGFYPLGPLRVLAGEALYLLPWIWLPMMGAAIGALRAGPVEWRKWLPLCLGAPPILLFALVALWARPVMFHWAAPGYLMLFPLLGAWLAQWRPALIRRAAAGTAALLLAGLALVASEVRWHFLPLPRDPGAEAMDWTALRPALAARGLLDRPNTVIGATGWREAGKVDYGLGGAATVICLNRDAREYGQIAPLPAFAGKDVVIVGTRPVSGAALAGQGLTFADLQSLPPVPLDPARRPAARLYIFLGRDLRFLSRG